MRIGIEAMSGPKYVAVEENGSWSVIDTHNDVPAVLDGGPQVGLSQDEAERVAETLNVMTDDEGS